MLSYESFFLIILISIIGPVIGLVALIFYNMLEKRVYLLQVQNKQILLEKELETSRYLQLNQQIQPHFLFNALNSIYGLIRLQKYETLTKSFEYLVLFIRTKYMNKELLCPLEKEVTHTKYYLEIQKLRFGDRLKIIWQLDQNLNQALIIPYLLQSLAENAFKHGIEMIEREAILEITIKKIQKRKIQISVKDNGPGFQFDPFIDDQAGVGMKNIKKRLQLIFGENASITVKLGKGGSVSIVLPLIYKMEEMSSESIALR